MAAAATNTSIFHLFTSLAPELRDQIWRAALPDEVGPVLYFYKKGGWCPRRLLPSDEGYDPENDDESNVNFEFRHDVLDAVQVEIPLFFVNREARNIALAWIREHNIEIRVYARKHEQLQSPVFVIPFDPIHNALYIALDKWDEFICEPDDRCYQPDMVEKLIHIQAAGITRIAMPEALFRGEGEVAAALAELIVITIPLSFLYLCFSDLRELQDRWFGLVEVLFILVDTPLDLQPANNGMKIQPRWKLENIEGGTFFWNHDRGRFDFNESEYIIDEALYKLIEEINEWLGKELVKNSIRSFEVRPVFAVRT
jgi:hypothetical protein